MKKNTTNKKNIRKTKQTPPVGRKKPPATKEIEVGVENSIMFPRIRVFAFEYVNDLSGKTENEWAKRFGVQVQTIRNWKKRKDVKEFMQKCLEIREEVTNEKLLNHQSEVIDELLCIIHGAKQVETRRKAIVDYFGLLGRRNVNTVGNQMVIQQNQQNSASMQVANSFSALSDEDLNKEIEFLEKNSRKKKEKIIEPKEKSGKKKEKGLLNSTQVKKGEKNVTKHAGTRSESVGKDK